MDYSELERLIAALESQVGANNPEKGHWAALWKLVREVGQGFKGVRYPTKGERDVAFQRFQDLVKEAKARGEQQRNIQEDRRREWEQRQRQSESAKGAVQSKAFRARLSTPGEAALVDFILFPITMIRVILEELFHVDTADKLNEIRRHLAECNEKLQDGWRILKEKKDVMLPGDRNEAVRSLQEAREQLDRAWAQWKGAKEQFHERRHREWEERNAERERKHRDFVHRVEANITKLESKLAGAEDALRRQEVHLSNLRDQIRWRLER